MTDYDPPYGWAIRRTGGCESSESWCYETWNDFWGCCPGGSTCPGNSTGKGNNVCCPGAGDCTNAIDDTPHCANTSWNMYYRTGWFCCAEGQTAYYSSAKSTLNNVGCSDTYPNDSSYIVLNAHSQNYSSPNYAATVSSTIATASTTASDPPSATSDISATGTGSSSSDSSSSGSSSTNTGAIAGGVVGGVAGAAVLLAGIWFLIRRQKRQQAQAIPSYPSPSYPLSDKPPPVQQYTKPVYPRELEDHSVPHELGSGQTHELP